jgi:hypothetical protein
VVLAVFALEVGHPERALSKLSDEKTTPRSATRTVEVVTGPGALVGDGLGLRVGLAVGEGLAVAADADALAAPTAFEAIGVCAGRLAFPSIPDPTPAAAATRARTRIPPAAMAMIRR